MTPARAGTTDGAGILSHQHSDDPRSRGDDLAAIAQGLARQG